MGFKISQEPSHHLKSFLCSQVELADGDLPVNQRMLRGFSICQVVGYMGMILLEPPKGLTFSCRAFLESEQRSRVDSPIENSMERSSLCF